MKPSREGIRLALLRAFAAVPFARPSVFRACRELVKRTSVRRPTLFRPNQAPLGAPRILLVRPDHIGDLLFATPAVRALRAALPTARLACMVGPWGEPVLENNRHLDEIIICEFPGFSRKPKASPLAPYRQLQEWATRLASEAFDMAVILRYDHWWGALLTYLAGIPLRIGYAIPECQPFLTCAVPYVSLRHEVLQNLTLVERATRELEDKSGLAACTRADAGTRAGDRQGGPGRTSLSLKYAVGREDEERVASYLVRQGILPDQALVAIHPGAGAAIKQWRPEAWAEVADALVERWHARIAITGSRAEIDQAWAIYSRMEAEPMVAAGDTSLGQLAALFRRCRLVMGPDCGPLHLAVAVGTPTVHLYGPADVRKFGPWGDAHRHIALTSGRDCIPCNRLDYHAEEVSTHPCMRDIRPETVLEAVEALLAAT